MKPTMWPVACVSWVGVIIPEIGPGEWWYITAG